MLRCRECKKLIPKEEAPKMETYIVQVTGVIFYKCPFCNEWMLPSVEENMRDV